MSRVLAEYVQTALVDQIGQFDRGARERNDLMVIREAKCPACLVEVVFMSNLKEELLLLDPTFRQKAAQGIVTGIEAYFQWREDRQSQVSGGLGEKSAVTKNGETATLPGLQEVGSEDSVTQTEESDGQRENTVTLLEEVVHPEEQL